MFSKCLLCTVSGLNCQKLSAFCATIHELPEFREESKQEFSLFYMLKINSSLSRLFTNLRKILMRWTPLLFFWGVHSYGTYMGKAPIIIISLVLPNHCCVFCMCSTHICSVGYMSHNIQWLCTISYAYECTLQSKHTLLSSL